MMLVDYNLYQVISNAVSNTYKTKNTKFLISLNGNIRLLDNDGMTRVTKVETPTKICTCGQTL